MTGGDKESSHFYRRWRIPWLIHGYEKVDRCPRPGHGHSGFREIQGWDERYQRFLIRCRHRCRDSWYPQSNWLDKNVPNCPEFPVEMGDSPASQVWFEELQPMISVFWMINSFLEHVNDQISKCLMVKSNYVWWNLTFMLNGSSLLVCTPAIQKVAFTEKFSAFHGNVRLPDGITNT